MDCTLEETPVSLAMSQSEPIDIEPPNSNEEIPPVPGSVALFGDGKLRFPNYRWNLGGFDILSNPLGKDVPPYMLQEGILDLEVSVEAVMLHILDQAVQHGGKGLNFCEPILGFQRD